MQMKRKLGLVGALAIAALVGCGSSSGGGSGSFSTSVPSGTKLTSLTPQQQTQLCTDFETSEKSETAGFCKLAGIEGALYYTTASPTDAMLQMACTSAYNSCLNPDGGSTTTTDSCDLSGLPTSCTATVGDLTTCTDMELSLTNQELAQLPSCSSLTMATLTSALATLAAEADGGTGESAACMTLESQCDTGATSTVGFVGVANRLRSLRK